MTAAFDNQIWYTLESKAWRAFDCNPTPAESLVKPSRTDRARQRKRVQVSDVVVRFRKTMESSQPPKSRDEAIRNVIGLIGSLLSYIFPQYALLISIISFLWDELEDARVIRIAGVASGAMEGRT